MTDNTQLESVKHLYLAFVLDDRSRDELIRLTKPQFSNIKCHHVTIDFDLTVESLVHHFNCVGKTVTVLAYGEFNGDGVDGVAVSINGFRNRNDGSFFHVTTSIEPPHKAVESNKYQDSINRWRGFLNLTGSFQLLKK